MTMTNRNNGNSSRLSSDTADGAPNSARFHSIDEMQSMCESDGWCIEFCQLQAGKLTANTVSRQSGDISLLDHRVSLRIEAVGEAPKDHITVLAPAGRGEFYANGQLFDSRGIFLLGPGAELHTVNNSILRVLSMHVPTSLLQLTLPGVLDAWDVHVLSQTLMIEPGVATVSQMRSLMRASIHQPIIGRQQTSRTAALTSSLIAIIEQHAGYAERNHRISAADAWRIIRRAREFIEANLAESISISTLSAQTSTSLSKLERLFRRELHMSPSQYILARRLAAVNSELRQTNTHESQVARVALDFGFGHLGRFAGVYRRQFGELPSETLRAD